MPDLDVAAMLDRVSRARGKTCGEIMDIALREYLEKHDVVFRAELARQVASIAAMPITAEDEAWMDLAAAWDDDETPAADAAE